MSKGNLLLGYGRGKLGDLVFYRANGEQITRARNRNPKNPNTRAQRVQRAVMATCLQAYSAGSVIFDHSFQGYSYGQKNMNRFLKVNLDRLRRFYLDEVHEGFATCACFIPQGAKTAAPSLYQVSEGSLSNIFEVSGFEFETGGHVTFPARNTEVTGLTLREWLVSCGGSMSDLYTFVGFVCTNEVIWNQGIAPAYNTIFGFTRLRPKQSAADTEIVETMPITDFFDIENGGNWRGLVASTLVTMSQLAEGLGLDNFVGNEGFLPEGPYPVGSIAVIRSQFGTDMRSNSFMYLSNSEDGDMRQVGIVTDDLLEAWPESNSALVDPEKILPGGDI